MYDLKLIELEYIDDRVLMKIWICLRFFDVILASRNFVESSERNLFPRCFRPDLFTVLGQ